MVYSYLSVCECAVMTTFGGLTRVSDYQLMRDPLAVSEHTHDHTCCCFIHTCTHDLCSTHSCQNQWFLYSPSSAGELDDIPEVAFYMVGSIEDVLANAEKLAQQQQ